MGHNESEWTENESLSLNHMFSGVWDDFGPTDWKIKPKTKKAVKRPENDKNVPKVANVQKKVPGKTLNENNFW